MEDVPSDLFHVIADPTRRRLLEELSGGERSVGDLVAALGVSQPTASKHLRVLREAGLVDTRAQGQRRFYCLDSSPLTAVSEWLTGLGVTGGVEQGEAVILSPEAVEDLDAAARRSHGVGRTMEQVTGRAQEFLDRLAKPRFGRRR